MPTPQTQRAKTYPGARKQLQQEPPLRIWRSEYKEGDIAIGRAMERQLISEAERQAAMRGKP